MSDNSTLDPGTGGDVIRDKDRAGVKTQIVGLDIGIGGSETLMTSAALADGTSNPTTAPWAGMLMCFNGTTWDRQRGDTTSGAWVNVKATAAPASLPLPTGASTSAKQPALGTAGSASTDVITIQGIASGTVVPVSGTVTATGPLTDTQLRATAVPVSGTVTANLGTAAVTNAGTFAVQDSQKIADNAGFTDGTTPVNPLGYIFDEVAGTALTENDIGAARMDSKRAQVLVIEDSSTRGQRATVTASGAVKTDSSGATQPVSAAVGTPVFSTPTPSTTGGWSKIKYAAQTTTVQTPKGTAATFGGYYVYNPNATVSYLQVFDVATATTVTLGTTVPDMIFAIPAASAANIEITCGVNMALGIKLACTTTATGSTAPTTGLDMTIFYK